MCSPSLQIIFTFFFLQCVLSIEVVHFDLFKYTNHWPAHTDNYKSKNSTYVHL